MAQRERSDSKRKSGKKASQKEAKETLDQPWAEFDATVGKIVEERLTEERLEKEWERWSGQKGKDSSKKQ